MEEYGPEFLEEILEGVFDINSRSGEGFTALHIAAADNNIGAIQELLSRPGIDVNLTCFEGCTAFAMACKECHVGSASVIGKFPAADLSLPDHQNHTPLWHAVSHNSFRLINVMILLNKDLGCVDLPLLIATNNAAMFGAGTQQRQEADKIVLFLQKVKEDRADAVRFATLKHGIYDRRAADFFALIVFLCDDHLKIKDEEENEDPALSGSRRFFAMTARFPKEIQMLICQRRANCMKISIATRFSEPAFKKLTCILSS